jgi:hypothetical protein
MQSVFDSAIVSLMSATGLRQYLPQDELIFIIRR